MINENDIIENEITETEYYIFNATNICRLFLYTPIIFCVSIVGSVIYDYVTYKDEEDKDSKKSD